MRIVIMEGPALLTIRSLWNQGQRQFVFGTNTGESIMVELAYLEWDNRPTQVKAIMRGKVLTGECADEEFVGTFNKVGAGIFDVLNQTASCLL